MKNSKIKKKLTPEFRTSPGKRKRRRKNRPRRKKNLVTILNKEIDVLH